MNKSLQLIDKLERTNSLSAEEYRYLIDNRNDQLFEALKEKAQKAKNRIYGNSVFIRGLIEISNICKNDCLYCGIRCSNSSCDRYRLSKDDILSCVSEGYDLGFRTFVMQGGEDPYFTDEILTDIIKSIKKKYPECAVTLSLGERGKESFKRLFDAGADRYLLRHETADSGHYAKLHPDNLTLENRMQALCDLKSIGYQVGCGFMVGSPFQTSEHLAKDLKFIEEFSPDMCGIGPFIPHDATPFRNEKAGTLELTLYLLSVIRLIKPNILLPATTALGTIDPSGREKGILAGANVVMPNLSPVSVRKKYELYNNKICTGEESAQCKDCLQRRMKSVNHNIVVDRGDIKK